MRTRNPLTGGLTRSRLETTVTDTGMVTPTMRRIRLVADEPIGATYLPGQHVRIEIKDPLSVSGLLRPRETPRTYTIWEFDPAERAVELRVHLYDGDGIGLRWARTAASGDRVSIWWPTGAYTTRPALFHLFVGEETASAGFGPMLRDLAPSSRVYGVLESESPSHDQPMPGPHGSRRVHRHGASAVSSTALLAPVADLEIPVDDGAAYLAGEASTCQMVRDHLVRERGWERRSITVKPFWARGSRGLH